jgi:hypothetical protein
MCRQLRATATLPPRPPSRRTRVRTVRCTSRASGKSPAEPTTIAVAPSGNGIAPIRLRTGKHFRSFTVGAACSPWSPGAASQRPWRVGARAFRTPVQSTEDQEPVGIKIRRTGNSRPPETETRRACGHHPRRDMRKRNYLKSPVRQRSQRPQTGRSTIAGLTTPDSWGFADTTTRRSVSAFRPRESAKVPLPILCGLTSTRHDRGTRPPSNPDRVKLCPHHSNPPCRPRSRVHSHEVLAVGPPTPTPKSPAIASA